VQAEDLSFPTRYNLSLFLSIGPSWRLLVSHIVRTFFVLLVISVLGPRISLAQLEGNLTQPDGSVSGSQGNLALHIAGLQDVSGNIFIAIYDSEDTWLGKDTVLEKKVTIGEALQDGLV
jgi:hypothetical protein